MSLIKLTESRTLGRSVRIEGRGVHSNTFSSLVIHPTTTNSGLRFIHPSSSTIIPAHISFLKSTSYATTLCKNGIEIQTVEHLLSALAGLFVFNADIILESEELVQEIPILDGSSTEWVDAFLDAGIVELKIPEKIIKIQERIEIVQGNKTISIEPSSTEPGLEIDYTIQFDQSLIGKQHQRLIMTPESYAKEISLARTFCLEKEIKFMKNLGLAKGGSLDNALVFSQDRLLNESLRYTDEPVRHKILDLMGDLALLGGVIQGKIVAHGAGHQLHTELCRNILRQTHS